MISFNYSISMSYYYNLYLIKLMSVIYCSVITTLFMITINIKTCFLHYLQIDLSSIV